MLFKPLSVLFLAATALADTELLATGKKFQDNIVSLDKAVGAWDGTLFGTLANTFPIGVLYINTLNHANSALKQAKATAPLDAEDADKLLQIATDISNHADTALATLNGAKEKADGLGIGYFIKLNIGMQQQLVNDYCNTVLLKVPEDKRPAFKALMDKNDAAFAKAISVYGS